MKPLRYAISYVIYNQYRSMFLIVQRPPDDQELPLLWGLPAGSVKDDEPFEKAIIRSGKEKLGVDLKPVKFIGRGSIERDDYILHMEQYEAEIVCGELKVPQPIKGITQYRQWKWGTVADLKEAADRGSLCCRIFIKSRNEK